MSAVLLIGVAIWMPGLRSRGVKAQGGTLMGSYGFTATDLSSPGVNPGESVGVITFDGAGTVGGSLTEVQRDPSPGATMPIVRTIPLNGSYSVNADGTGTMALRNPDNSVTPLSFVITDGGLGFMFIITGGANGNVLTAGSARMQ